MARGPLIILSGPSGSGKSTLVSRLLQAPPVPLRLSISATTRPPRPYEIDGQHYYFLTTAQFEQEKDRGGFLEWAQVHGKDYYGTLRREVEPHLQAGLGVVLDIDVQGAEQVRKQYPEAATIFVRASSVEAYEDRLRVRGEAEAAIQRRLNTARTELARSSEYQYQVINDDLETAVAELTGLVRRLAIGERHAG